MASSTYWASVLVVVLLGLAAGVQAGDQFEGTLSAGSAKHKVKFTLKNIGAKDATILLWNNPVSGYFDGPFFKLSNPQGAVKYEGVIARRSLKYVLDEDFKTIKAGASEVAEIDLQQAFSLKAGVTYKVKPEFVVLQVEKGPKTAPTGDDKDTPTMYSATIKEKHVLKSPEFEVKVDVDAPVVPPPAFEEDKTKDAPLVAKGPVAPAGFLEAESFKRHLKHKRAKRRAVTLNFACRGLRASRKAELDTAIAAAVPKIAAANTFLNAANCTAKVPYSTWFGAEDAGRIARVKAVVARAVHLSTNMDVDCSERGCRPNWYAYVIQGTTVLHTCKVFFAAQANLAAEQLITVLHEITHMQGSATNAALAETYDLNACQQLAINTPADAVENAENYAQFMNQVLPNACP